MNKLKCIIVDDEQGSHLVISHYLKEIKTLILVESFYSSSEALHTVLFLFYFFMFFYPVIFIGILFYHFECPVDLLSYGLYIMSFQLQKDYVHIKFGSCSYVESLIFEIDNLDRYTI